VLVADINLKGRTMYLLLIAALAPAVLLMWYVYTRDKTEKEPMLLVLRVFVLGAASGIVAGIVESILFDMLEASLPQGLLLIVVEYFVCVALVEELCKFFALNTVKRRPEFDYIFDAVVYSVAAALGFAALENVFYVLDGGLETALVRAVLSVPGHAADGVVMGVFYGIARQRELHGKPGAGVLYFLAILLPTIEHGFYDAALSLESDTMAMVAMLFDLAFIALAFVLVKRMASKDEPLHPGGALQGLRGQISFERGDSVPYSPSYSAPRSTLPHTQAPAAHEWTCSHCGMPASGNFCGNCGSPKHPTSG